MGLILQHFVPLHWKKGENKFVRFVRKKGKVLFILLIFQAAGRENLPILTRLSLNF